MLNCVRKNEFQLVKKGYQENVFRNHIYLKSLDGYAILLGLLNRASGTYKNGKCRIVEMLCYNSRN